MKSYDISLQEKGKPYCVPSCIQAIFRHEGIEVSQDEVYDSLEKSERGFVFFNGKIIEKFFRKRGFDYKSHRYNETPFNDPGILLLEMNDWKKHGIVGIDSHAFLFEEFREPILKLLDPRDKKIILIDSYKLISRMYRKKQGVFGLVKKLF